MGVVDSVPCGLKVKNPGDSCARCNLFSALLAVRTLFVKIFFPRTSEPPSLAKPKPRLRGLYSYLIDNKAPLIRCPSGMFHFTQMNSIPVSVASKRVETGSTVRLIWGSVTLARSHSRKQVKNEKLCTQNNCKKQILGSRSPIRHYYRHRAPFRVLVSHFFQKAKQKRKDQKIPQSNF